MKKYELTDTTITFQGRTLHQIRYLMDVGYNIKAGNLGGWVETEKNLSQRGNAVVCDNAKVYGNAMVCDNAEVYGNAVVSGNAKISKLYDLLVIGPIGSRHSFTSFYRSQDEKILVSCGCFHGDISAFRNKVCETHMDHPKHLAAYLNAADFAEKLIEGRA